MKKPPKPTGIYPAETIVAATRLVTKKTTATKETKSNGDASSNRARLWVASRRLRGVFKMAAHDKAWLVNQLLPAAGLAVLFGKWKTYKSFIVLDLAVAVARRTYGLVANVAAVLSSTSLARAHSACASELKPTGASLTIAAISRFILSAHGPTSAA